MKTKFIAMLLVIAMLFTLAACGSTKSAAETPAAESVAAVSAEETPAETAASVEEVPEETAPADAPVEIPAAPAEDAPAEYERQSISYPIANGDVEFSIFMGYPGGPPCVRDSWEEYELFAEAEKDTGIKLDWHQVSMPESADQLQLLVAAGDLTDLVTGVQDLSGGLVNAYDNDLIYDLHDMIETAAPDYYYLTRITNDLEKDLLTDEGYELAINVIHDGLDAFDGLCLRQDWLDAQGLAAPTTYEELETVLAAFTSNYDLSQPVFIDSNLSYQSAWLAAGYGVGNYDVSAPSPSTAYYLKDGSDEVTIALVEDGYKEYISMLADWYKKGYINSDFVSQNYTDTDKQNFLCNDQMGLFWSSADQMATYYSNAVDEDFSLVTLAPISQDGSMDMNHYCKNFVINFNCVCISTNCDDPELALNWLNYWYTDKGIMMMNYGMEGQTYNIVDGKIAFTDLILNNPDYPDMNANGMLMRFNCQGKICGVHNILDKDAIYTPEQIAACDFWGACLDNAYTLPYGVTLTTEESATVTPVFNEIATYASTALLSFVTGSRDMAEWDSFVAEIEKMGIYDCIKIYQTAYDRYLARS